MPPSFGNKGLKPEPTRLRQIALVAKDIKEARRVLTKVLGVEVCYVDPGVAKFGLENFLIPLGGDIIEVVSPIQPNTTAGRLLDKRGDGGYMIIMQSLDAKTRRDHLLSTKQAKIIWGYEHGDWVCAQYHPKGIKGGMMPELDSCKSSTSNPEPLKERFSPWHACGEDYKSYAKVMKDAGDLSLSGALLRLAPGDMDTEGASRQWETLFGVGMSRDLIAFTNARMGFVQGQEGKPEGLHSITVNVRGGERFDGILQRASEESLCGDGWMDMCGVRWYFNYAGGEGKGPSRL